MYLGSSTVRRSRVPGDERVYPSVDTMSELLKQRNSDISQVISRIAKKQVKGVKYDFVNALGGVKDDEIVEWGHVKESGLA